VRDWQLECRAAGVLVRPLARGIAVSPPLICGGAEIALLADGVGAALDRLGARARVPA
jgi:putrescine---pyruvate transaminase